MQEPQLLTDGRWTQAPPRTSSVAVAALISVALLGAPICVAGEVDRGEAEAYVEEVIVTAERLKKGAIPTQTVIVQTYDALRRGKRLYNARRYGEALPHLLLAAKRGFKWAQAMAGDIYLHGRGGVPRSIESGMGWLGVASRPQTALAIRSYFDQAMAEIPASARAGIADIVAHYREQWSSRDWRVSCRRSTAGTPMGMGVMSLRLNKRLSCAFTDEVPVCREPLFDTQDILNPDVPPPFGWVCQSVTP